MYYLLHAFDNDFAELFKIKADYDVRMNRDDANTQNLMLRSDIVNAVKNQRLHIWAVDSIDQGIEILTGVPAGAPDESGNYPDNSISDRVKKKLEESAVLNMKSHAFLGIIQFLSKSTICYKNGVF